MRPEPTGSGRRSPPEGVAACRRYGLRRARRLDAACTVPAQASAPPERVTVEMTFSDFGTPVSVSRPPASEVFIPANVSGQPGLP